jgi:hypothetical protein
LSTDWDVVFDESFERKDERTILSRFSIRNHLNPSDLPDPFGSVGPFEEERITNFELVFRFELYPRYKDEASTFQKK